MEEEAHQRAEALLAGAAGSLMEETGIRPQITVRAGEPVQIVRKILAENDDVAALVLGAAAVGAPGPLVSHFAGLDRSEEHTSELQSLMRISYAVFCLKKKTKEQIQTSENH